MLSKTARKATALTHAGNYWVCLKISLEIIDVKKEKGSPPGALFIEKENRLAVELISDAFKLAKKFIRHMATVFIKVFFDASHL